MLKWDLSKLALLMLVGKYFGNELTFIFHARVTCVYEYSDSIDCSRVTSPSNCFQPIYPIDWFVSFTWNVEWFPTKLWNLWYIYSTASSYSIFKSKYLICPLKIIMALSYPPGSDYLAARSGLEESFHLLYMARTVGGKQRVESCTTSCEHCLS